MSTPNGLKFILILGSYDPETKTKLDLLKGKIVEKYVGKNVYPFLLDSIDVYSADSKYFLVEKHEDKISVFIFDGAELDDVIERKIGESLEETVRLIINEKTGLQRIERRNILEEYDRLMDFSKIILLIRQKEETRGGEYLELIYALNKTDPSKIWFFHNRDIELSGMLMEFLDRFEVKMRVYTDETYAAVVLRVLDYKLV